MSKILSLLFLAVTAVSATKLDLSSDVGNWTVGDCILAQFALEFTVPAPPQNKTLAKNETSFSVVVAADAKASGTCGDQAQELTLKWTDIASNSTEKDPVYLGREMTVKFERYQNDSKGSVIEPSYGVSRIWGTFNLSHFEDEVKIGNETKLMNITGFVEFDTGDMSNSRLQFRVPLKRSFLCSDIGQIQMETELHYSYPNFPPNGISLANTTANARNVRLDAFRDKDAPTGNFQTAMDCDAKPNDIVPIIVGVALCVMIVGVIVAYIWGRRRSRQRGYQSV